MRTLLGPSFTPDQSAVLAGRLTSAARSVDWSRLPGRAARAVFTDFESAVDALLDVDLGDVLVAGWRAHGALTDAGRRTLAAPGVPETVLLDAHQVTRRTESHVEVLVNGAVKARIPCAVCVVFEIKTLTGRVRDGRLMSLYTGDATITVSLDVAGERVAESEPRQIQLAAEVDLGEGLLLVGPVSAARSQPTSLPAERPY